MAWASIAFSPAHGQRVTDASGFVVFPYNASLIVVVDTDPGNPRVHPFIWIASRADGRTERRDRGWGLSDQDDPGADL